jgi:hypothetical protein
MGEFAHVVQQELARVSARGAEQSSSRHAIVRAAPRIIRNL